MIFKNIKKFSSDAKGLRNKIGAGAPQVQHVKGHQMCARGTNLFYNFGFCSVKTNFPGVDLIKV